MIKKGLTEREVYLHLKNPSLDPYQDQDHNTEQDLEQGQDQGNDQDPDKGLDQDQESGIQDLQGDLTRGHRQ